MTRWMWIGMVGCLSCTSGSGDKVTDTSSDTGTDTDTTILPTDEPWCAVDTLLIEQCSACHSAGSLSGGLDMFTDPEGSMSGVVSSVYGVVIIAPGDAAGSLLYRKMAGSQAADEGGVMPTTGALDAGDLALVANWIDGGAPFVCSQTTDPPTGERYHPAGWDASAVHGLAAKLQTEADCRDCHGDTLDGGTSDISCDSCHSPDWRTDCTYCHGDSGNGTGAPPDDIDGESNPSAISFPEHEKHVESTIHPAYDCIECHDKPIDVLTAGHLFDDSTPGEAEVSFGGLSDEGSYTAGTCGNLYCHGDGDGGNGTQSSGDGPMQCTSCHSQGGLSGRHDDHIEEGLDCDECHGDLEGFVITNPDEHVDGNVDVDLPGGITYSGGTCDGSCHFEFHNGRTW